MDRVNEPLRHLVQDKHVCLFAKSQPKRVEWLTLLLVKVKKYSENFKLNKLNKEPGSQKVLNS